MKLLSRLFGRSSVPASVLTRPAPERPVWVVGDVHGCDRLLGQLLDRIASARAETPADLVLVGDYVDRGDESRAVLARLPDLDAVCLLGNHERMMFDFLDDPLTRGNRWLRYGGLQTLASFGIGGVTETTQGEKLERAADALRVAMGQEMLRWLRDRPLQWTSGTLTVVHAAADPQMPLHAQSDEVLLWGHPDFLSLPRTDGAWVAHGHTIVPEAGADAQGRIAVDTGAYMTRRLTAALISPDGTVTLEQT
ncbi:MAG: metallophosphoesterase [Alphaproteobacteria bacterium]|nr:metallophosphoesterase [Alphaproteobacteria bacterium]